LAKVVSINLSAKKGEQKTPVQSAVFKKDWGIEGDAHAGPWHRQVSLLAEESIDQMRARVRASGLELNYGDFAENITTAAIEVMKLPVGSQIQIGSQVVLEITQIGKECHQGCAIREKAGDCVMPREGVFARVVEGGTVSVGDAITIGCPAIRVGVITASDKGSAGARADLSGPTIREMAAAFGGIVTQYRIVPDEKTALADVMAAWSDQGLCDLILTTGGTGLSPRDVTPEATLSVVERLVPGIPEAMRAKSLQLTDKAMLSRSVAGTRGRTLIINLPGSPKAVRECLEVITGVLPHAIETLRGEVSECARK
jgi:molybdenum cofactor synthesis domain-containing protein